MGGCRIAEVEDQPRSKASQVSSDRAQPPPDLDGLGFVKEPGHGSQVLLDVREQLGRRQLLVELVEAENSEFCLLEH
jgi:hypothetical protein